ncbi:hypothetical protein PHYBOEH_008970 [Phytophthora boehmeriae]|uniref:Peptidase S1 domain-containing protein n=1 Tax=Phytophthora boehmeriae TaxID=109152 RepID=A0A8T1VWI4_9STRA|nr:hypothetical protein PHYBOEH_008970 [Phytophthora boehmeriae]
MKINSVLAIMLASAASLVITDGSNIQRELIVGGETVPANTKTYIVGLRPTIDGDNFCGGSLITPTHVLSASHCNEGGIRWVSIGSHFRNGTQDGEQIRVRAIMNHPDFIENYPMYSNDFVVLKLEKPSSFKPVKLAAADDSDFEAGKWTTTMGWGLDAEGNGTTPYELQRVDVQLVSDESCANFTTTDPTMVCAGGVEGKDSCNGDSGGPLIIEGGKSTEDVLVGVVSWGEGGDTCARDGYFGMYSRVSSARAWIDSIINDACLG